MKIVHIHAHAETAMNIKQTTLAAALALLSIGPAHAERLKPFQGRVIDLGDVSGVAYYSVELFVSSPPSPKRPRTLCLCGSWPRSPPTKA
jgi:hypothetical protein